MSYRKLQLLFLCAALGAATTMATSDLAIAQQTVLIDFGRDNNLSAGNYNNVAAAPAEFADVSAFPTLTNMINTSGVATTFGIDLVSVDATSTGVGIAGLNTPPAPNDSGFIDSAAADSIFLKPPFGNVAAFQVSDLSATDTYSLRMYGFLAAAREPMQFTVGGSSLTLDPQNNNNPSSFVDFAGVSAAGGTIDIEWSVFDDPGTADFAQGQWSAMSITNENTNQQFLIDFGRDDLTSGSNYNNIAGPSGMEFGSPAEFPNLTDMIDSTGSSTAVDFSLASVSPGASWCGAAGRTCTGIAGFSTAPAPNNTGFLDSAAADSLYVNNRTEAVFELSGLDPAKIYDLDFFGFITAGRPDTLVTINGDTQSYDPENNNDGNTASFAGISPDGLGVISFAVTTDSGAGFRQAQLGALRVTEVPEPTGMALFATYLACVLVTRRTR